MPDEMDRVCLLCEKPPAPFGPYQEQDAFLCRECATELGIIAPGEITVTGGLVLATDQEVPHASEA